MPTKMTPQDLVDAKALALELADFMDKRNPTTPCAVAAMAMTLASVLLHDGCDDTVPAATMIKIYYDEARRKMEQS